MQHILPTILTGYQHMAQGNLAQLYTLFDSTITIVMAGDKSWPITGTYYGLDACKDFFENHLVPARIKANTHYDSSIECIRKLDSNTAEISLSVSTRFGLILESHCFTVQSGKIHSAKFSGARAEDLHMLANIYKKT